MLISIAEGDARPLYVQIMDEVRRAIVVGALGPDEALPSVRQLASDLRVNPNTVQQAYRELEREGTVYVRRGQGTFASAAASRNGGQRRAVLSAVVERALRDAYRHGLTAQELAAAMSAAAAAEHGNRGEGAGDAGGYG